VDILLRLRLAGQRQVQRGLQQTGNSASSFGRRAAMASGAAVGALGALGIAALDAAGDYEKSLNVFQAVSSANKEQMDEVGKAAKRLGADVKLPGTSAADAAIAMTALAKGGLSVRDSLDSARSVLQLSAAAQVDNERAAIITARALNTFSLRGTEAARVTDLLAGASNASTAEITDIALGMQQAGASAAKLGVPIEDLTTLLGVMANKGIAGSDAGTSLKQMMSSLIPTTTKQSKTMRKLGIDVFDSSGKFVGVRKAIQVYGKALKGLTTEQQAQTIETLFGSDASRAANIVLLGGTKAYDKMHKAVTKTGSAQKLSEAQTKGFKGSLEAFKSTVETLAITWGSKLLPAATSVMQFLSANLEPAINGVVGAVSDLVGWFDRHKTTTTILISVVGGLTAAFAVYKTAMIATAVVQGVATAAQWALNAAMTANPIGLVVLALVAVGAALVIAYKRSAAFRNVVNTVWGALKTGYSWIKGNWPLLLAILTGPFGLAALAIKRNFGSIVGFVRGVINGVIDAVNAMSGALNKVLPGDPVGTIGHIVDQGAQDRATSAAASIGRRASGGPVTAGKSYLVNEQGQEIFTPGRSGYVHDAKTSAGMMSGAGLDEGSIARIVAAVMRNLPAIVVAIDGQPIATATAKQFQTDAAYAT